jgi:hypothetical protein
MNVLELYNNLQVKFPKEKRYIDSLAWPLHQPTLGVQYVDKNGNRVFPYVDNPVSYEFPEPLRGAFYQLPVVGITLISNKKWKSVRFVVKNGEELTLSSVVSIRTSPSVLKGLANEFGISWYHVNFDWPWKFTILPSLDDCVKYERETNENSL